MAIRLEVSPGRSIEFAGSAATIGSDPGCAVAYPGDPRLQPQHAVLRSVAGRWMIEAKGQQPLRVGGNTGRVHWLNPGDVVHLTPEGPELVFEPVQSTGALPATNAATTSAETVPQRRTHVPQPALWAVGGAALVICGMLAAVALLRIAGPDKPQQDAAAIVPDANAGEPATASQATPVQHDEDTSPVVATEDIRRALYTVVVSNPDQGQVYQLGTAWAASQHHLITSAAVATAVTGLHERALVASVRGPAVEKEFEIAQIQVHPLYQSAVDDADRAQQQGEDLVERIEQSGDEALRAPLMQKLEEMQNLYREATSRQGAYDIAVLEVKSTLPATLHAAAEGDLAVGTRTVLAGVPFGVDEHLVDPGAAAHPLEREATVLLLPKRAQADARRVIVRCEVDGRKQNWSGSPLVTAAGKVVAMYSRVTVAQNSPGGADTNFAHQVTEISRLKDFATGVWQAASAP